MSDRALCARCGQPMPKRRNDGTGLLRTFCSRKCAQARPHGIVINTDQPKDSPTAPTTSWWLGKDQARFYTDVHDRQPTLKAKYGSAPISTIGPIEPGFTERGRRAKARIT